MERAFLLNMQIMDSRWNCHLSLVMTVNTCHFENRHTLMKIKNIPLAYVNVKIIKHVKRIALTYISCVFHRNAAFVGAWGQSHLAGVDFRGRRGGDFPAPAASGPSWPGAPSEPVALWISYTVCGREAHPQQSHWVALLGGKEVALRSNLLLVFLSCLTGKIGKRKKTQLHFQLET